MDDDLPQLGPHPAERCRAEEGGRITLRLVRSGMPDDHQQNVSISQPACGIPGGTRWLMWTQR